jgi:transposase
VGRLGLDETSFLKATRLAPTRYVTGLVDLEQGRLLDVVADRTRAAVDRWLHARTRDWLAGIATVALDPWRGYASALVVPLGHVTVVVDHFHAIKLANTVVDQVRRRTQQATLGHRGRKRDPLYRIRKLLLTAAEQLTSRGRVRLRAGLAAGDPGGEVVAAWQGKELLRAVYAASDLAHARAALERFYRWADGVGVAELSRLARTVRAWEAEILAFHSTKGCSNGPTEAVNLLIKSAWNGRLGSASLVGHPRRTAGGATTGRSRPPWQGSHSRVRSTSGWTCTATPSRSPRCRLIAPRPTSSRSPATRRRCWRSSAASLNPAACGSATRRARPATSWPGCCTPRGSPAS